MTDSADERAKVDRTKDSDDPNKDVREEYTSYREREPDRGTPKGRTPAERTPAEQTPVDREADPESDRESDPEAAREADLQPGAAGGVPRGEEGEEGEEAGERSDR